MRKCPFCKAEIEDNARFCLYCMKPLNEKEVIQPAHRKMQWWLLAACIVVLALVLLIPKNQDIPQKEAAGVPETEQANTEEETTLGSTEGETTNPTEQENPPQQEQAPLSGSASTPVDNTPQNQTPPPQTTIPEQLPDTTTPEQTPETTLPEQDQDTTTPPQTQEPESTQPEDVQPVTGYTYRLAQAGDEYSAHYTNSGNDIVITGVPKNAADGVYRIPGYIDGKRVITIDANAFYGSNARVVYLPETVRYVKTYAFNGCQITDIYFTKDVYIEGVPKLESGAYVVLHCPRDCRDRNYRYYSSFASYPELYGATWEEWNG